MAFVLGLVVFGVALWLLFRLKQRDLAACREILGLDTTPARVAEGTTPEGFGFSQTAVLQGTLEGRPATLWNRRVRYPKGPKHVRRGSIFTVLELTLAMPARAAIRLQPAGMLETIETFVQGAATDRVPIDAEFDAAYIVYSDNAFAARDTLTPELRARILAFRAAISGNLPTSTGGRLASAFVLGTFHVEGTAATYSAFGSPTKATATHVKTAAPLLLALAR